MAKLNRFLLIGFLFLTVAGCQRRSLMDGDPSGGSCEVHFSAGSLDIVADGTATKAPGDKVALTPGSTVRVVAYRRTVAGQAAPDLTQDKWIATATYKVQSDGTTLVACAVLDDGTEDPAGQAAGMELSNGTYDFYAYSAARKLEADNRTVKGVGHGEDFLGVYLGNRTISRSASTVQLDFEHECTKLTFSVVEADGMSCDDLAVSKVALKRLATAPAADYTIGGDLAPTVGTDASTGEITSFSYIDPQDKGAGSIGSKIFLPKSLGTIPAEFTLTVNSVAYLLKAELPAIALEKGNNYLFTARVKPGSVDLILNVLSWDDVRLSLPNFGGDNSSIAIGSWGNIDWTGGVGGNTDVSQVPLEVGSWTPVVQSLEFLGSNAGGSVGGWDGDIDGSPEFEEGDNGAGNVEGWHPVDPGEQGVGR